VARGAPGGALIAAVAGGVLRARRRVRGAHGLLAELGPDVVRHLAPDRLAVGQELAGLAGDHRAAQAAPAIDHQLPLLRGHAVA